MLDDKQVRLLEAVADTIIPPDDWPGAVKAGVCRFIVELLGKEEQWRLPAYQEALAAIDRCALDALGLSFAELDGPGRTAILKMVENHEPSAVRAGTSATWLSVVARHCAEGYYADPGNGGNEGAKSWEMIGYKVTA